MERNGSEIPHRRPAYSGTDYGAKKPLSLNDITIRTELKPGDIGYIVYLHGKLYKEEYNYGIEFETYVASGLSEFYKNYNPKKECVWICEHNNRIVGSLFLVNRGEAAQLRYFLLCPEYRGIGLGSKLITLFMEFFRHCGYKSSYLWTTHELAAAAHLYTQAGFVLTEEKESTSFGKRLREQRYDLIVQ
ncbi:MAG: GNAT family N-acetyltransferase [Bacteroidota bacterium]|nr:GNAT family N-acetyltransferase [Bacteroidota bacterium]